MKTLDLDSLLETPRASSLRLVPVTQHHADQLARIFATLSPWSDYGISAEHLSRYLQTEEAGAPRLIITDAKNSSREIGALGLRFNWMYGPYIQFLALVPAVQSQGIGTAILNHIEQIARDHQQRNLWVVASEINHKAIRFYENFGFKKAGVLEDLVADGHNEVLFRKHLIADTK